MTAPTVRHRAAPFPDGCRHCGVNQREHFQRWKPPVGWHQWTQPTQQQIKDRMLASRAEGNTHD